MAAKKSASKPASKPRKSAGIPVQATKLGYYGDQRRYVGDKFTIADEEELGSWMHRLDGGVNPKEKKAADDVELDEVEEQPADEVEE